jgi:hypothetical protein
MIIIVIYKTPAFSTEDHLFQEHSNPHPLINKMTSNKIIYQDLLHVLLENNRFKAEITKLVTLPQI